jgi:hypothetical protein
MTNKAARQQKLRRARLVMATFSPRIFGNLSFFVNGERIGYSPRRCRSKKIVDQI